VITDSLTHEPLDSAWVLVESIPPPATYYADEAGAYEVWILEGESPTLKAGKEGYQVRQRSFTNLRNDLAGVDVELSPDST
jgi:hypothetical protein